MHVGDQTWKISELPYLWLSTKINKSQVATPAGNIELEFPLFTNAGLCCKATILNRKIIYPCWSLVISSCVSYTVAKVCTTAGNFLNRVLCRRGTNSSDIAHHDQERRTGLWLRRTYGRTEWKHILCPRFTHIIQANCTLWRLMWRDTFIDSGKQCQISRVDSPLTTFS